MIPTNIIEYSSAIFVFISYHKPIPSHNQRSERTNPPKEGAQRFSQNRRTLSLSGPNKQVATQVHRRYHELQNVPFQSLVYASA
jgi:hypothetical protein